MCVNTQVTMFEMLTLQHTFTSFNESRKLQTNTAFNAWIYRAASRAFSESVAR